MELIITKNGHVFARSNDDTATSEDVFELVMEDSIPEYPEEDAGKGKYWNLDYQDGSLQWVAAERELTDKERMETLEGAVDDETALTIMEAFPLWRSEKAYTLNDRVRYSGKLYKCITAHTSQDDWTPDATPAMWNCISLDEWPEWVQPTGAQDAYNTGDKVSHNDKHYTSTCDSNVWEPGVYGWEET